MKDDNKTYSVFLVDADECSVNLIEAILLSDDKRKYLVEKFPGSPEAFKRAKAEKPDFLILDINMPVMNGFEICQNLKSSAETKDILVMLMTAYSSSFAQYDGLVTYRADCYIAKPFSRETLLRNIENLIMIKEGQLPCNRNNIISNFI
jgi:CheY-like chemotaxis protein